MDIRPDIAQRRGDVRSIADFADLRLQNDFVDLKLFYPGVQIGDPGLRGRIGQGHARPGQGARCQEKHQGKVPQPHRRIPPFACQT